MHICLCVGVYARTYIGQDCMGGTCDLGHPRDCLILSLILRWLCMAKVVHRPAYSGLYRQVVFKTSFAV